MSGGGDTPQQTLFVKISTQDGFNFVGEIKPYQNDEYMILIYGYYDTEKIYGFDNDGLCIYDNIALESAIESYVMEQANSNTGLVVSGFDLIDSPVSLNETLPEWSKYVQIGDTPVQTHNIALLITGSSMYAPAAIIGDVLHVYISAENGDDTSNRWVVNADGKVVANNGTPLTEGEYTYSKKAALAAEGYETSSCVWEYKEFELNETIADWNSYVKL